MPHQFDDINNSGNTRYETPYERSQPAPESQFQNTLRNMGTAEFWNLVIEQVKKRRDFLPDDLEKFGNEITRLGWERQREALSKETRHV